MFWFVFLIRNSLSVCLLQIKQQQQQLKKQPWRLAVNRRVTVSAKCTCAVPPARALSDQASIRCDSAKNKRCYLLLALGAQEVLPLPALGLVCAVLLQVLQFGGGRQVVSLAGAVGSLPQEDEKEGITSNHFFVLVFFQVALVYNTESSSPHRAGHQRARQFRSVQ